MPFSYIQNLYKFIEKVEEIKFTLKDDTEWRKQIFIEMYNSVENLPGFDAEDGIKRKRKKSKKPTRNIFYHNINRRKHLLVGNY